MGHQSSERIPSPIRVGLRPKADQSLMRILFALCLVVGWTGTILAAENDAARCRHYRTDEPANDPESQWKFGKGEFWTCHDCQRVESCLPRVLSRLKSAAERDYLP